VAFCGDGINDSAALAYADVSISFAGATDIARETADVVLMEDDLRGLIMAVKCARQAMDIIWQNTAIVAVPNLGALVSGIFFALDPILAVVINNGTAILAELNGLRPLMGPGDAPTLGHHLTAEQIAEEEQRLHEHAGHQTVTTTAVTVDVPATPAATNGKAPAETVVNLEATNGHTSSTNGNGNGKVTAEVVPVTLVETNGNGASNNGHLLDADEDENAPHLPAPLGMMRQADLAKRLGVPTQTLTSQRLKDDFTAWSKSKDPEAIAWFYEPATKCFYTIEVEHHLQGMEPDESPVEALEDDLTTVEV
jgi:Cu2+-exporting ATPase